MKHAAALGAKRLQTASFEDLLDSQMLDSMRGKMGDAEDDGKGEREDSLSLILWVFQAGADCVQRGHKLVPW